MTSNVDRYKHFEIGATEQERLVEMWKYFNPKDDPQPLNEYAIYISEKKLCVANHVFMEVLKYQVFDERCVKIDRWQVMSQNILTARPVDLLYQAFIDLKSAKEPRPKKTLDELAAEETDKKEKKPRKK